MRTNRKLLLPAAAMLAFSGTHSTVHAAEYGMGISLSSTAEIFFPINLSQQIRLEPSVLLSHNKQEFTGTSNTTNFYALTIGLFAARQPIENTTILAGVRLGYQTLTTTDQGSFGSSESKSHSPIVAHTLAVEYFPVKSVALGADASLRYSRNKQSSSVTTDISTRTSLTVKYFLP